MAFCRIRTANPACLDQLTIPPSFCIFPLLLSDHVAVSAVRCWPMELRDLTLVSRFASVHRLAILGYICARVLIVICLARSNIEEPPIIVEIALLDSVAKPIAKPSRHSAHPLHNDLFPCHLHASSRPNRRLVSSLADICRNSAVSCLPRILVSLEETMRQMG